jgi:hypothetical protein
MSAGAYTWDVKTGERVFSNLPLSVGFPEQSFEYADVNSNANVISILPGWPTLNLEADGIDRFNFNKQCVQMHKLQVTNVSFIVGDPI